MNVQNSSTLAFALFISLCFSGCSYLRPNGEVNGSVFVVTKGAGSYKLSLVKIFFWKESDYHVAIAPLASSFVTEYKGKYQECISAQGRFNTSLDAAKKLLAQVHDATEKLKEDGKEAGEIADMVDKAARQLEESEASRGVIVHLYQPNAYTVDKLAVLKKYLVETARTPLELDTANKIDEGPKKVFDQGMIDGKEAVEVARGVRPCREELLSAQDDLKSKLAALSDIKSKYLDLCMAVAGKAQYIAETDADGEFKLTIPKGYRYVALATATRAVGANEETYHWIIPLAFDNASAERTNFTNDNELFNPDGNGQKVIELGLAQPPIQWNAEIPSEADLVHIVL